MMSMAPFRMGCAALALAIFATPVAAAEGDTWSLALAANGTFSVETPCTASELEALEIVPELLADMPMAREARILCLKDDVVFLAGTLASTPQDGSASLFDEVAKGVANADDAKGAPQTTLIDGRRAMINREEVSGKMAQAGFVELNDKAVLMIVVGVQEGSSLSSQDQALLVDRYYSSIKVISR